MSSSRALVVVAPLFLLCAWRLSLLTPLCCASCVQGAPVIGKSVKEELAKSKKGSTSNRRGGKKATGVDKGSNVIAKQLIQLGKNSRF